MREKLDIPRFWWRGVDRPRKRSRAGNSAKSPLGSQPTASAGFSDASELIAEPNTVAGHRPRSGGRLAILVGVALFAGGAFVIAGPNGRVFQTSGAISEQVDQLMLMAGLGVDEIHISGHRYTLDGDIFAALDLERPMSLLRYNSEAARRRIEALSWVARATVTRVLPDAVEVKISERTPVAVWLHEKSATLVDAEGRQLARVTPSTLPALPRISGDGAPEAVGALVVALAAFPVLAKRVVVSARVGQRRWSLDLDNGSRIHLPGDGETAALGRLMQLAGSTGLLTQPGRVVDLRIEDRIAVAPRSTAPATVAAPDQRSPLATPTQARARKSASAL